MKSDPISQKHPAVPPDASAAPVSAEMTGPASDSRRKLLRGGLAAAPVVMTVASRPVLGQVACTASAGTSMTMQTSLNHNCTITSGLSPEKWKSLANQWPSPYSGAGSSTNAATTAATTTTTTSSTSTSTTSSNRTLQQQLAGTSSGGTSSTGTTGTTTTTSGTSSFDTSRYYGGGGAGTTTTSNNTNGAQTATMYHCPTTGLGGHVFSQKTMVEVIDLTRGGLDSLGRYTVAALLNARSGRTPMLNETTVRAMWNDLMNRGYFEPTAGIRWGAAEIVAYIKTTIA